MTSIWHKPGYLTAMDDNPKVSKDGRIIYWTIQGWNIPGDDVHSIGVEWAYIDDLVSASKALDVAIDTLKEIGNNANCTNELFGRKTADKALEKISEIMKGHK